MAAPRILLCGDVLGRLNNLFKRVSTVNKSTGPFDALLCVGQFFPNSSDQLDELSQYIDGHQPVPIPTYFIGDYGVGAVKYLSIALMDSTNQGFKMDGLKICKNLYWLKGSGKFSLHGLSVAYLSGRCGSGSQPTGVYSEDDVDALRAFAEEPGVIDLFLTNEWPTGILNGSDTSGVTPEFLHPSGTDATISQLAAELKPRYHIAGSKGVFYVREPYSNDEAVHVTRFLGLAPVGNKDKQKFIHAISPTPAYMMSAVEISLKPPNTTLSPYKVAEQKGIAKEGKKRTDISDAQYWRFDVSQKRQKHENVDGSRVCFDFISTGSCSHGEKCNFRHDVDARDRYFKGCCFDFISRGKCERGSSCNFQHSLRSEGDSISCKLEKTNRSNDCWFCLSNPNLVSHLVLSIGEHCYCALPKGPLVRDHVLLIPIEHCSNTLSMAPDVENELDRFKSALRLYFRKQGKAVVFYEYFFEHSLVSHANLQAIPVPLSKVSDVKQHFASGAEKLGFEFPVIGPSDHGEDARKLLRTEFDGKSSFFYAELPDATVLSHSIKEKQKFPAQFGREVLAGLFNIEDKADWRNCELSKEDELQMAEGFKKRFEEFDPTQ